MESRFLPHTWQNHSKWHDLDRCPAVGPALSDKCGKSWASGGDEIFFSGLSGAPSVSLALSSVKARRPYLPPAELVASSHAGVADECLLERRRDAKRYKVWATRLEQTAVHSTRGTAEAAERDDIRPRMGNGVWVRVEG